MGPKHVNIKEKKLSIMAIAIYINIFKIYSEKIT